MVYYQKLLKDARWNKVLKTHKKNDIKSSFNIFTRIAEKVKHYDLNCKMLILGNVW